MPQDDHIEVRKMSFDYAWKWFELHAKQRIDVFRLYTILLGICFAGIAASIKNNFIDATIVISAFGGIISVVFERLDARTRQLINHGENYLEDHERHFTETLSGINHNLTKLSSNKNGHISYTKAFRILFYSAYVVFVLLLYYYAHLREAFSWPF